jgi:hypothetical protein
VSSQPLVYVHGAGPQQPVSAFKHELDTILFGRDMPNTRVGYYADVRWPPGGGGGGGGGGGSSITVALRSREKSIFWAMSA